jgi:beta-lactam-binding protein with PASTA domain
MSYWSGRAFGVVLVLALTAVLAGCPLTITDKTVPNLVGRDHGVAVTILASAGFTVGNMVEVPHATVPVGVVVAHDPAAGTQAVPGTPVHLTVSKGIVPVSVPNLAGQTRSSAAAVLAGAGLVEGTVTFVANETVPAGQVLAQNPSSGASVTPGSAVDLTVSAGREEDMINVPDVISLHPDDARAVLEAAGFAVKTIIETYHYDVSPGLVCRQYPGAGTLLHPGGEVTIGISLGIGIRDIEELQKIGNDPAYPLNGTYYVMGFQGIDASATAAWNNGAGFEPIGTPENPFTGKFDGDGDPIRGLHINRPGSDYVGLFGYASGATIWNVNFDEASVTGRDYVGALVGKMVGGDSVTCSANNGTVSGVNHTGGLAGYLDGVSVTDWWGYQQVSGTGNYTGGIAGTKLGAVMRASCSGITVTGVDYVGGLAGYATGVLYDCVGEADITASGNYAGGVAGYSSAEARLVESDCNVTASGGPGMYFGGLFGTLDGALAQRCSSKANVNNAHHAGGLVGLATNGASVSESYATGAVSGTEGVGGLVGTLQAGCDIGMSYAVGAVSGTTSVGGLVGAGTGGVVASFWDTQTSGQASSAGGSGKLTAEMKTQSTFTNAGWNFTQVWSPDVMMNSKYPSFIVSIDTYTPVPVAK